MAMSDQYTVCCPCCCKPITEYRFLPETGVCEFMPCKCHQTWTVHNGQFVGGSSTDRRIEHPHQPYWDSAKEAANRILGKTCASHDPAAQENYQDARTVAAAFLEAIQW